METFRAHSTNFFRQEKSLQDLSRKAKPESKVGADEPPEESWGGVSTLGLGSPPVGGEGGRSGKFPPAFRRSAGGKFTPAGPARHPTPPLTLTRPLTLTPLTLTTVFDVDFGL